MLGAAASKQSDYLPHAIPLHRVSAPPRSFLVGLDHQDPLGKAGEIYLACRRAG